MKLQEDQSLDSVLESAVVLSWADLIQSAQTALIHLEYGFAANGTVDYLKVWSSITRGHWLLACEYWMSESRFHSAGIHFENGYRSEGLAFILELIMQHQTSFLLQADLGRQGLLQIQTQRPWASLRRCWIGRWHSTPLAERLPGFSKF
jgi:hypothetical protein